ncbi:hypothetical protein [Stieleria maiorica]|nr:hypothetical protein [Stieleria maiorica]
MAAALSLNAIAQEKESVSDDDVDEVASIFSGYALNLQSLESYDLLIEMDKSWVSDQAPVSQTLTYVRLMIDRERQQYLSVERATTQGWVRPGKEVETQRSDRLAGAISLDGDAALRLRPDLRFSSLSLEQSFSNMQDTPDIQNIGLFRFPAGFRAQKDEKRSAERKRLLANINKIDLGDRQFKVEFQVTDSRHRILLFDRTNMVPRSSTEWFTPQSGEPVISWKESYFFSLHQGIRLPDKIVQERIQSKEINSKKVFGTSILIADFHWLRVNETLDDKYFTKKTLGDANLLLKLSSPTEESEQSKSQQ